MDSKLDQKERELRIAYRYLNYEGIGILKSFMQFYTPLVNYVK